MALLANFGRVQRACGALTGARRGGGEWSDWLAGWSGGLGLIKRVVVSW